MFWYGHAAVGGSPPAAGNISMQDPRLTILFKAIATYSNRTSTVRFGVSVNWIMCGAPDHICKAFARSMNHFKIDDPSAQNILQQEALIWIEGDFRRETSELIYYGLAENALYVVRALVHDSNGEPVSAEEPPGHPDKFLQPEEQGGGKSFYPVALNMEMFDATNLPEDLPISWLLSRVADGLKKRADGFVNRGQMLKALADEAKDLSNGRLHVLLLSSPDGKGVSDEAVSALFPGLIHRLPSGGVSGPPHVWRAGIPESCSVTHEQIAACAAALLKHMLGGGILCGVALNMQGVGTEVTDAVTCIAREFKLEVVVLP